MVKDGYLYGFGLAFTAVFVWMLTHTLWLSLLPLVFAAFFLWFFRDPQRVIPGEPGAVVSPGDGKVTEADWIETPHGSRLRLSIFLSVFDVHVNRAPVGGVVLTVQHRAGQYLNAMNPESGMHNEQTLVVIDAGEFQVSYRQIAGLLARRIVCPLKVGDTVRRGQRVGMIKFGSRVDVLLPGDATLAVKVGDRVKGGATLIAMLPVSGDKAAA